MNKVELLEKQVEHLSDWVDDLLTQKRHLWEAIHLLMGKTTSSVKPSKGNVRN